MRTSNSPIIAILMLALAAPAVGQQEVSVEVSVPTRSAWVGSPVELTIFIMNTRDFEQPALPDIENGRVVSGPSSFESRSSSFVNGRRADRIETRLTYALVADEAGEMLIPAFTVRAAGREFRSRPIRVQVREAQVGDVLALEVTTAEDTVYLGQPVELTLDVYIKPFTDDRLRHTLNEGDMWSLVNQRVSTWGPFQGTLEELAGERRRPRGQMVDRRGANADRSGAYRYRLSRTFHPTQAGPLALDGILAQVEYPLRLGRSRGIFESGLQVVESVPVRARAEPPDLRVLPIPLDGRPPWFSGAVGTYDFVVTAAPLEVAVGDPITLTMEIIPADDRGTKVELLAPPLLAEVRALDDDFRLPVEPPTGTATGRVRRFTQSIRARRDTVSAIPAIPFVSFVPETGTFETVWSDPIPITVKAGTSIDVGDVVGAAPPLQSSTTSSLTEVSSGLQANYADAALLLSSQAPALRWWMTVLLALPPLFFAATAVRVRTRRRAIERPDLVRMRKAGRGALRRLHAARGADAPAEAIGGAMCEYVADRVHRPAGGMTRAEAVAAAREAGLDDGLCAALDEVLQHCEAAQYAGAAAQTPEALAAEAETLVRRMERAAWSG